VLREKNFAFTHRHIKHANQNTLEAPELLSTREKPEEFARKKEISLGNGQLLEIVWQSQRDSNPCLRRERAIS
jgi:hypothetical protein